MAYELNKTDGAKVGDVNDNNTLTKGGLTFFGKNLANYGERLNENFIKILENFSKSTAPTDPLVGQLWWDSTNKLLKVRADSNTWKAVGNPAIGTSFAGTPQIGDLWWDSSTGSQQLKLWTGSAWLIIGPESNSSVGASGIVADTVVDTLSVTQFIIKIYVSSVDVAIISNATFTLPTATPPAIDPLPGFPRNIIPGINLRSSGEAGGLATSSIIVDNTNIRPRTDNTTAIGTNLLKFSSVYATNFYGSGANLTNIQASNITGVIASSTNASTVAIAENNDNEIKYLTYVDATTGSLPANVSSSLKFTPGAVVATDGILDSPKFRGITFESTATSGTAPFTVASNTEVTNLRAATSTKWASGISLTLSGAVTGGATAIDGSGNVTILTTLGNVTTDISVGAGTNITPSDTPVGQLVFNGNGYKGYVALDGTAMHIGHNVNNRGIAFGINETTRVYIDNTGKVAIGGETNPVSAIDVKGPASVTSFTGTTKLGVFLRGSTANNDYTGIDFTGSGGSNTHARIGVISASTGSKMLFGVSNDYTNGITHAPLTVDGISQTVIVSGLNNSSISGNRNRIINGKMEIAQRGTSFAGSLAPVYPVDRFFYAQEAGTYGVAPIVTASRSTDIPGTGEFQFSSKVEVTTADTVISASNYASITQAIEGYNVRDLIGRPFTLSFWVKSSKLGTHCVAFRNGGGVNPDRSYVGTYTINVANTWEYKTITITDGLITAGTWNWTNGIGLIISWMLAAGSNYATTAGSWQTGNYVATSGQVNCLDTIGNVFAITGVQLEPGTVATPFEHRLLSVELAMCQRYFEKSYNLGVSPGTATYVGTQGRRLGYVGAEYLEVGFKASKRDTAVITYYSPASGTSGKWRDDSASVDRDVSTQYVGENAFVLTVTVPSAFAYINGHWAANADFQI